MNIRKLSWRNIVYNPLNTILSILLMTFGVGVISLLLLLNNQIDKQLQDNLRGIDMVIGAKGSPLQLILSSIYHIDNPTGNISYKEVEKLTKNSMVDITIPLSYGDSYNGFRIVGTTQEFIDLYNADLSEGILWDKSMQVVIGSAVADITNLSIGDMFCGTHGFGDDGHVHDHHHYEVVGILKQSNTTIDKLIITDTKSVWDVHNSHDHHTCEDHDHHDHHHADENHNEDIYNSDKFMITAMLVRFKSPVAFIQMPRKVNETTNLQAAMPVLEINRLTNLLGFGVQTINVIALVIILVSGISIFISLYNSLRKRRYELALIRVHGATKLQLIKLVLYEGLTLSLIGTIFGLIMSRLILFLTSVFNNQSQIFSNIKINLITEELWLFLMSLLIGLIASLIPSILVYKINIPKILSNE